LEVDSNVSCVGYTAYGQPNAAANVSFYIVGLC
jgi:hypothetical protein